MMVMLMMHIAHERKNKNVHNQGQQTVLQLG